MIIELFVWMLNSISGGSVDRALCVSDGYGLNTKIIEESAETNSSKKYALEPRRPSRYFQS